MCTCVLYMQRPEADKHTSLSVALHLVYWSQVCHLDLEFALWGVVLTSQHVPGIPYIFLLSPGVAVGPYTRPAFTWVLGIRTLGLTH